MKKLVTRTPQIILITAAAVLLGFALGRTLSLSASILPSTSCDKQFALINPYLQCESDENLKKKEYGAFKQKLESFIQEGISLGDVQAVSVYFRDLENGPWFGIGEHELFSPASMIKLPVLVAYYKRAMNDPLILTEEITIDGPVSPNDPFSKSFEEGETYPVNDLLRYMVVESDNVAFRYLFEHLQKIFPDEDPFGDTITAMGFATSEGGDGDFLTVKRYASIYRILYNASFLSKDMSQKALGLLMQTTFTQGIRGGIPEEIPVAHKYGIRKNNGSSQLHDCGIVYYPENHYLLCIMTKGKDVDSLSAMIHDIAAMMHAEVVARNR